MNLVKLIYLILEFTDCNITNIFELFEHPDVYEKNKIHEISSNLINN